MRPAAPHPSAPDAPAVPGGARPDDMGAAGAAIADTPPPPADAAPRGWIVMSLLVVAAASVVCWALEAYFEPANLILVYTTGVVYAAWRGGRAAALLVTAASILAFDLLFVPPRWLFKPTDPQYYFTFAAMAAFGWLVSELASRMRAEAARSEARAWRAQVLARLSGALAQARTTEAVARAAEAAVTAATGWPCHVHTGSTETTGDTTNDSPDDSTHDAAAPGAQTDKRSDPTAESEPAAIDTPPAEGGLRLPLAGAEAVRGAMHVRAPADLSPETRTLLDAMASQTALALDRAAFEQRSVQARVDTETERLRSTLLASVSHDFRTPLTTIIGAATSLLQQAHVLDAAQQRVLLEGVLAEAQRLHALSSNLLELTRIERGAVSVACEWCPADELVVEALAAVAAPLAERQVTVHAAPDALVWCDPRLVQQALVNLLDNVARHTPAGTAARVVVQVEAGGCRLTVADDGPGLTARRVEHAGGLGLAICGAIARLHGGRVVTGDAAHGPGAGTRGPAGIDHAPTPSGRGATITLVLPQPPQPAPWSGDAA